MAEVALNDVNLTVATENGSGSASSNALLFRALLKMGLAASAKNYFPSNIQGLPTWYQIRVSTQGYLCRKDVTDIMVAFNPASLARDQQRLRPGGLLIYDTAQPPAELRPDIQTLAVPAQDMVHQAIAIPQLRTKLRNMVYVGTLAALLGIPLELLHQTLQELFGSKEVVLEPNRKCMALGYDHVKNSDFTQTIARLEAIPGGNAGKIVTDTNTASALGAIFGGVSVVAWYPITPSTSLVEVLAAEIEQHRTDEQGRNRFAIVQTEDELASISMVVGAGWAGARAMTATSGPGLSLMQEGIGLAYFTEVPLVLFHVGRAGPSTGLPTRTQQADITLLHQGSHGDTRHIVLIPHDNPSAFEMGWLAFDLADRYQTPVMVMTDLDLGMNLSMSAPFDYPDKPMDRGRLLTDDDLVRMGGDFHRYRDVHGDGVPLRTIPGMNHPAAAYFTRGSGHDENARYTEDATIYKELLDRLRKKYETARTAVPAPVVDDASPAPLGLISFGATYEPTREARDLLAQEGISARHMLLRALPLSPQVRQFIARHDQVLVVEQNRDGQMTQVLRDDYPDLAPRIQALTMYNGMPATAGEIVRQVKEIRNTP